MSEGPEPSDPESGIPVSDDPEPVDPESDDPESDDPEPVDPESDDPDPVDPEPEGGEFRLTEVSIQESISLPSCIAIEARNAIRAESTR